MSYINSTTTVAETSIEADIVGVSTAKKTPPVYNADTLGRYANLTNSTRYDPDYYFDYEYVTNNMEISKDYVLDYSEYRKVLDDCNKTMHDTPYPDDGEYSQFKLFRLIYI